MKRNATRAAGLLKTLSNPARLMILCQLINGEQSAGALWEKSSLSQSAFSQHLAVLRLNKIVKTRKDAQTIYYTIADHDAERVLSLLYDIYCH